MSIALYHHAGVLKSFESDERKRLQRAFDLIDSTDDTLEPHYRDLWRDSDPPSDAARARCALATLPHLQAALTQLLRIVPNYIALPLRIIPKTAWSADETFDTFRDQVDIRMGDLGMAFVTSAEFEHELRELTDWLATTANSASVASSQF